MDHSLLSAVEQHDGRSVMATIIAAFGHAYRKPGSAMLFAEDGRKFGSISPGCMEDDLQERVPALLAAGVPVTLDYDLQAETDPYWGGTIGCGGRVRILLEKVEGRLKTLLVEALGYVESGETVRLLRFERGGGMEYRMDTGAELQVGGDDDAGSGRPQAETSLYTSVFAPRPRLVIFGAGAESEPVCALAARIGFRAAVADWREPLCEARRFPGAELAVGEPEQIVRELSLSAEDYVLICSHQLNRDRAMLEAVLPLQPQYLGVLGSSSRIRLLFEGLTKTANVRAPVGLDIGSEGAEEIAVSIAAELIAVRNRRSFPFRDDKGR